MGVKVILYVLVLVLFAASVSAICSQDINYNTLVCGSTPDSALGYGAVDICGICYPCGAADGVCPEDFATTDDGRGSCRFCPDPDCEVLIDGSVENNLGDPQEGARIMVLYENEPTAIAVATTLSDGTYSGRVRTGYHRFYVDYADFDSRMIRADIERSDASASVATIDFVGTNSIEPGTCSADCTDTFDNRCKASCNNINGCSYPSYDIGGQIYDVATIAALCDDKEIGSRVFLGDDNYIECCMGGGAAVVIDDVRLTQDVGFGNAEDRGIENLVTFVQRARQKGERVDVHIAVWQKTE